MPFCQFTMSKLVKRCAVITICLRCPDCSLVHSRMIAIVKLLCTFVHNLWGGIHAYVCNQGIYGLIVRHSREYVMSPLVVRSERLPATDA